MISNYLKDRLFCFIKLIKEENKTKKSKMTSYRFLIPRKSEKKKDLIEREKNAQITAYFIPNHFFALIAPLKHIYLLYLYLICLLYLYLVYLLYLCLIYLLYLCLVSLFFWYLFLNLFCSYLSCFLRLFCLCLVYLLFSA